MEIKVGEYVRTKKGNIGKVLDITTITRQKRKKYLIKWNISKAYYITSTTITKHSPNIIDLIELGDYVNGYLINYIPNNEKAIYHDASDCEDVEKFENKDIETIVTKEQFAEMEYKV